MTLTIPIPVPLEVFTEICDYKECKASKEEISELIGKVLRRWLNEARTGAPVDAVGQLMTGYQWKQLFLPEGTRLRTVFKGRNFHAIVEGERILYDGVAVSPAGFVGAVGGARRNAWTALWLLFPLECTWKSAAACRNGA